MNNPSTKINKIRLSGLLAGAVLVLSACESLGPQLGIKRQLPSLSDSITLQYEEDKQVFKQLGNEQLNENLPTTSLEEYIGTGTFIASDKPEKKRVSQEGKYTLNFDGADLREVTKIILSDMLQLNYIINPKVRGQVTLQTTEPLTKSELLPTLEMLFRMNNVALIKDDDIYRVEPALTAIQSGVSAQIGKLGQSMPPGYQVRIIPLKFVGVNDMEEILKPIMPPKGILRKDASRNILMVAGTGSELQSVMETVAIFDVNVMQGMSFGLYPLENIEASELITELEKLFDKEAATPMAGMFKFVPIERLNAVMIITPQAAYLKEIKKWVLRLDRTDSLAEDSVIVYRVQHVVATELAITLESVFSGSSATIDKKASIAPGKQPVSLSNKNRKTKTASKKTKITLNKKPQNSNSMADLTNVQVIADEPNNALIIMAKPHQFKMIESIVKQLDIMPLQVLVDADIFEVSLTDDLEYGVKWKFTNDLPGGHEGIGVFRQVGQAALSGVTGGFSYGVLGGSDDLRVIVDMMEQTDKINVVSSPSLLVLNNQEASIQVGDQVPVRLGGTTNNNGTTENIQMRDTGVTLNITPRVNANGVVIMDIEQSVDNVSEVKPSGIDSPTITQRRIETSVAVTSGETIVLGGLISERHTYNNGGVPFLKDLPWIGAMFSTTSKNKDKKELIVMITPTVVVNKYDARKVTREFQRKLTGIYEELPEINAGDVSKEVGATH